MTGEALLVILVSQVCLVMGQVGLKHAMNQTHLHPIPWAKFGWLVALAIVTLAAWFILWLGLASVFDLSYLYPFDALSPVLVVLAARIFLGEKMSRRLWLGVVLISCGLLLVGMSS